MEEQKDFRLEPIKPIAKTEIGGRHFATCPRKECMELVSKSWKFCPHCGQAIKWED